VSKISSKFSAAEGTIQEHEADEPTEGTAVTAQIEANRIETLDS